MENLLLIQLLVNNEEVLRSHDIVLDLNAPTTNRKFTLNNVSIIREDLLDYRSRITVRITYFVPGKPDIIINEFDIVALDFDCQENSKWWVDGIVYMTYEDVYRQSHIDVIRYWQNGNMPEWSSLGFKSPLKQSYLYLSAITFGPSTDLLTKDDYRIDFSQIRDGYDFLYFVSLELLGEKKYLGGTMDTFRNCLLEIYSKYGAHHHHKIQFINTNSITDPEILKIKSEAKELLLKYGFLVYEVGN